MVPTPVTPSIKAVMRIPAKLGPMPPRAAKTKKSGGGPFCKTAGGVVTSNIDHQLHEKPKATQRYAKTGFFRMKAFIACGRIVCFLIARDCVHSRTDVRARPPSHHSLFVVVVVVVVAAVFIRVSELN
jgi:hypothetical protein